MANAVRGFTKQGDKFGVEPAIFNRNYCKESPNCIQLSSSACEEFYLAIL